MNQKKLIFISMFFLCLVLQNGCGKHEDTIYLETTVTETETTTEASTEQKTEEQQEYCYVYVCGAVTTPGVYQLEVGSRIYEALAMAGGLTEEASTDSINQAEVVVDGQMVRIPTLEERVAGVEPVAEEVSDGKLNLNTATIEELMTLPGIGQAKAESILRYRDGNGGFSSVEDVMKVEGIKEGVYNRIKENIKVK